MIKGKTTSTYGPGLVELLAPRHPNQDRFIKKGFIDDIAKIVDMREKFYIMPLKRMITKDSIDVFFYLSVGIV